MMIMMMMMMIIIIIIITRMTLRGAHTYAKSQQFNLIHSTPVEHHTRSRVAVV